MAQMNRFISLILGGGVGSRLYPLTKDRSKPAVPIGGKYRLIDIPISNCLNAGLNRIFVLTQFNSASLNRHVKNTFHFDSFNSGYVDILAAEQTRQNMNWFQGTADAVRQSARNVIHENFDYLMILSGDQLYHMDIEAFGEQHIASGADLTIATIPVVDKDATAFGIMKVAADQTIDSFIEKPSLDKLPNWKSEVGDELASQGKEYLASMGIYCFTRNALRKLLDTHPDAIDFGKEIIPAAIEQGYKVSSYAYDGYWTDIGDIASFFEANIALTDDIPDFNLFDNEKKIFTNARQLPPSKIFGTKMSNSIVAEGAIIHAAEITKSVIGIRARIGSNSVIRRAYIMGNDFYETIDEMEENQSFIGIGSNCHIEYAIIDKHVTIGDNVSIRGGADLADVETDNYYIRKGIVVINKGAVIPSGAQIGVKK